MSAESLDDPVLWRGMTRPELDAAYDNSAAVSGSARIVAGWRTRSGAFRARHPDLLDLAYGERARNRLDLFRCGQPGAPLLVFIHGGYWQRNDKDMFACMAEGPLARGFDVALVGYTLAPEIRLGAIVAEIGTAIGWLRRKGPALGVGEGRLIVSGWSAGGHLTAAMMGRPDVDGGLAISGIFDLEPCRLNYLNDALHLDADEVAAQSPLAHLPARAGRLVLSYGLAELPELQRQSRDYEAAWVGAGLSGSLLPLAGHNHFTILDELTAPDGRLVAAALDLVTSPRATG